MRNHGWANDDKECDDEADEPPNSPNAREYVFEKLHFFNSKFKS